MFASYERRVLEGDRSTTILHNFIKGIVLTSTKTMLDLEMQSAALMYAYKLCGFDIHVF